MSGNEEKMEKPCCSKSIQENDNKDIKIAEKKYKPESKNGKKFHEKKDTLSVQMGQCQRLLNSLRKAKEHSEYAQYFYYPVDPIAYQCLNYYDVIKNPMDLSTMNIKMEKGEYKTPEDFEADIRLIIDNCLTYNGSQHEIVPYVNKFKEAFEARFQKIMNPKPRTSNIAPPEQEIAYRKSSRSFIFVPDDEDILVREIAKTQKYLAKLYAKHKIILNQRGEQFTIYDEQPPEVPKTKKRVRKKSSTKNPKKNAKQNVNSEEMQTEIDSKVHRNLSSSSDDEDDQIPMSYSEKRDLVLDINKLPGDKIKEISRIVKTLDPKCYTELDNNFEISFADCKVKTLRELQKITNAFFRPKPARAVPFFIFFTVPRKEKLEKNRKLVQNLKIDLEQQMKDCETKLATVEDRLAGFIRKKATSPQPQQTAGSSTSSGSSSSSTSSSSTSSSDSSSDSEYKG
ncbi:hypothetical protein ACKWTF_009621 [Chironomus riparius]